MNRTNLIATAFLCFACGSKPEKAEIITEPTMELAEPEAEVEIEEVMVDGKVVYANSCTPCHGADGKLGVAGASDFTVSELNQEEIIEVITNGRNTMLAYGNILTTKEINAVAEYIGTLKNN